MDNNQDRDGSRHYYSAEFKLNQPEIFYHFKIRKSSTEPLFAVVKEGSRALDNLNQGDIIRMHYHFLDKSIPIEERDTRIKYITRDSSFGFKDHFIIGLDIQSKKECPRV